MNNSGTKDKSLKKKNSLDYKLHALNKNFPECPACDYFIYFCIRGTWYYIIGA